MLEKIQNTKKTLGIFQLVMINVIAVDSIRTLPFAASFGSWLVVWYMLATVIFFLPTALISAELGTGWPTTGGIYVWVREAFGKNLSLLTIWLSWIYNIVWYPTIVALIAGTIAYCFDPRLAQNPLFMSVSILIIFWLATLLNCFGMRISAYISTLGAIIGTILPMLAIGILGAFYWLSGFETYLQPLSASSASGHGQWALLTNVLFGLMGLEMAATHAREMKNPQRDYPRSLFIAAFIILLTIVTASLAIAAVVPQGSLSLATGAMQALEIFFSNLGMPWAIKIAAGCIILGSLSGMGAWIIGPTKGIMIASEDGQLPKCFAKKNRHGVPTTLLYLQGAIVSLLALTFLLLADVNSSFWLLSAITAELALLVYVLLFAAAIKLHYSKPHIVRSFKVPGKKVGIWLISGSGLLCSLAVIAAGFIPPEDMNISSPYVYISILLFGMVATCLFPFLLKRFQQKPR